MRYWKYETPSTSDSFFIRGALSPRVSALSLPMLKMLI